MYKIIETHCHLDYLKNKPLAEIIEEAKAQGIEKIITISVEPDNFDSVKEIAESHDIIYYTQGIHPHDAKLIKDDSLKIISSRCLEEKMVAVGEIGLDYYYDHSPHEKQIEVFKAQLQIAIDQNKPVVIHSREADDDMIEILKEYAPKMKRKGVVHSFTSGEKLARTAIDLGFYLGFNGIITFKNAQNVREIVAICPLDRILTETDSPFLTPIPHRGKENSPAYLPYIIEKIADIKELPATEIEKICYQNALDLFF